MPHSASFNNTLPLTNVESVRKTPFYPFPKSRTVSFAVPMSLLAYTGLSGEVVIEPGAVEV